MSAHAGRSARAETFATLLRHHRESAALTQAELAELAGLGERTVSNLERGVNTSPYPRTVRRLADVLGLSDESRIEFVAAARGAAASGGGRSPPTGGYLGALPATRLVARDIERTAILDALSAAADAEGRALLVAGEPGIGKTRLAQEAVVMALERGFVVATGRCYQPQRAMPFAPFFDAIAALLESAAAQVREGITDRWPALVPLLPDELPAGLSAVDSAPDETQRLYRAATGLVREIAAARPVALLLDDLHWADGASLELFAHVARHTRGDRVLLLGAYRDVEIRQRHPLRELVRSLCREGIVEAITLDRFDREATTRLLIDRLDDESVSEEFGALIHRHTRGNPLFTVETLNALIDRGDVSRVEGRWVRREVTELELDAPASVSEIIGERVSRLSPPTQDVLKAVSVFGEVFDVDDLAVVDADERTLERALDEAIGSALLTTVDDHYAFDHVLTQQALYGSLSPAHRRRLHRLAGEQLERRPHAVRRRRATELAHHMEHGGAPDRAVPHLLVAGASAADMHAYGEALRHYRRGLELAEEAEDEALMADALERLGQVLMITANHDEAVEHLVRAASGYQLVGDEEARLRVEDMIANALYRRGSGEAAAARLAEVIADLDPPPGPDDQLPAVAALCRGLAVVRLFLRQHTLALQAAEQAVRLARAHGEVAIEAGAEAARGTILLFLDSPDEAVDALEAAISLAAPADVLTAESDAILALQWARTMRGELDTGRTLGQRGLEITRRSGDTDAEALHTADIGLNLFYAGDWAAAEDHLERSLELASTRTTLFSGIPPAYLGLLRRGQGNLEAAAACYTLAVNGGFS